MKNDKSRAEIDRDRKDCATIDILLKDYLKPNPLKPRGHYYTAIKAASNIITNTLPKHEKKYVEIEHRDATEAIRIILAKCLEVKRGDKRPDDNSNITRKVLQPLYDKYPEQFLKAADFLAKKENLSRILGDSLREEVNLKLEYAGPKPQR
ncbi:MAG: hypothetical protein M3R00_10120 [Pseudomonadota bacterium]|nr:hypothetical protein [Pseudomonadota bacterium]